MHSPFGDGDRNQTRLTGLGLEFTVILGLWLALGAWAGRRLGSLPAGLLAGFVVGFAIGLWWLIRQSRSVRDKENLDHE
jgi:hypothetical protein